MRFLIYLSFVCSCIKPKLNVRNILRRSNWSRKPNRGKKNKERIVKAVTRRPQKTTRNLHSCDQMNKYNNKRSFVYAKHSFLRAGFGICFVLLADFSEDRIFRRANEQMKLVYLSRSGTFSAAHRLHSSQLSNEENLALYGKCNHPHSHGHNYRVTVTVRGVPNEKTGMVVNMADMKIMLDEILQSLDIIDMYNLDIEYFSRHPSTSENLAIYIWEQFEKKLIGGYDCDLAEVKVDETEHNSAVYKGERPE